jgi:hypothetical protein
VDDYLVMFLMNYFYFYYYYYSETQIELLLLFAALAGAGFTAHVLHAQAGEVKIPQPLISSIIPFTF